MKSIEPSQIHRDVAKFALRHMCHLVDIHVHGRMDRRGRRNSCHDCRHDDQRAGSVGHQCQADYLGCEYRISRAHHVHNCSRSCSSVVGASFLSGKLINCFSDSVLAQRGPSVTVEGEAFTGSLRRFGNRRCGSGHIPCTKLRKAMRVRKATRRDFEDIRGIHLSAFPEAERDLLTNETDPPTISLVCESDGVVAGHVAFSPVRIKGHGKLPGYILAPLAILPDQQKRGWERCW